MTNTDLEMMSSASTLHNKVSVTTSARLHMGFFDLNGNLGRHFGGIGLSLHNPVTALTIAAADKVSATGPVAERATKIAEQIMQSLSLCGGVHIELAQAIPEHSGLGSGTQLSLAIGMAISHLFDLNLSVQQIASIYQ